MPPDPRPNLDARSSETTTCERQSMTDEAPKASETPSSEKSDESTSKPSGEMNSEDSTPSLRDLKANWRDHAALARYAWAQGRNWRELLPQDWASGRDERMPMASHLRRLRNYLGPTWLAGLPAHEVKSVF